MTQNFSLTFSEKGLSLKNSKVKVNFEKSEFGKLQFVLKTAKWNSQNAVGKIVRFDNEKLCQFKKEGLYFAIEGKFIAINFSSLPALCQEIRDNVHKCVSLEKIKIEFPEKTIIQNLKTIC